MSQIADHASRPLDIVPLLPSAGAVDRNFPLPKDVHSPLAHSVLEDFQLQLRSRRSTTGKEIESSQKAFNQFCRAEPALLEQISYPTTCGAMCRDPAFTPAATTKLRDDLLKNLSQMVKTLGGPKFLLEQEMALFTQSIHGSEDMGQGNRR